MQLYFHKYHGTGNDFILIDNRDGGLKLNRNVVASLCNRHFGIGADGLMLLESARDADFRMVYFNSDGGESTMCGNGGRCIVAFAHAMGVIDNEASFLAIDGRHLATIEPGGIVSLQMNNVNGIRQHDGYDVLDTGSPHYVRWVDNVDAVNVVDEGRNIRNQAEFAPGGINVNFVSLGTVNTISVRTYERGVEDETLSCGTGVTAAAIAASRSSTGDFVYQIKTPGGNLDVRFTKTSPDAAEKVVLRGPAVSVFEGDIYLKID